MENEAKLSVLGRNHAKILGVRLDSTQTGPALRFIRSKIARRLKFSIVTPNPEIVLLAEKDEKLRSILNSADISLSDGAGLVILSRLLYGKTLKRVAGRTFFVELIKLANKLSWRVFLLGGTGDEAKEAKTNLEKSFKTVKIETAGGPRLDIKGVPVSEVDKKTESDCISAINNFKPHILFIGFGAPKQEKWMAKWLPDLDVGGAMVVGGTFNYISGKSKIPPEFVTRLGLEWLWRLLAEPGRIRRILNAVVIFPAKAVFEKFRGLGDA